MNNAYLPFKAAITGVMPQTASDYTYRLATDLDVRPGQFMEVSIPGVGEAPISVSDFGSGWIEMTIRNVGRLTGVIHELKPGGHFFIRGPYGHGFPLEEFTGRDLIIAAGGTGLAPVKSILSRHCSGQGRLKSLTLLAGFKTPSDMLFKDEISAWREKIDVQITVDKIDENSSPWDGSTGLITGLITKVPVQNPGNTRVIIVGPPVMMKFSALEFLKRDIARENIWVSFERKMCCGLGKCGHCKIDDTYVCLEGPVFNYTRAEELID